MHNHADGEDDDDSAGLMMHRAWHDDGEIDNTALIDVTFLLLIFFITTSTMDPTKTGTLPTALNGLPVSATESAVIFLGAGVGTRAIVKGSEGDAFSDDEETQTSEIVEYVTFELDHGKKHVMILGDSDVRVGEVTRVQRIIGDAFEEISKTYIAVKVDSTKRK